MRMYLEDLNDPDTLYKHVSKVRNVQWFDDKGEPVDDERSELASKYTEYALMCKIGEITPMAYNDWRLVQDSLRQADTVKIDPESIARIIEEEERRHNEYLMLCQQQNVEPLDYWDWLEFDKKYQEHVRTAGSPLSPATFQKFQEMNKTTPSITELGAELTKVIADRNGLREANSKLALRCQELVDSYEGQKSELWKKIEGLRDRVHELTSESELVRVTKERDDLAKDLALTVNHKNAVELFTQTLRDELGSLKREALSNKQSYSDEDYENLLQIRDELILENEELIKELDNLKSSVVQRSTPANQPLYPHYFRKTPNTTHVDINWFLEAWDVGHTVGHAVKKLMCLGQRGVKGKLQDLEEARNSLNRAIELEHTK